MIAAVLLALASSVCYGICSVLHYRGARQVPARKVLHPGLIADLIRNPSWMLGNLMEGGALLFQVLALSVGAVAVVQPLLVTGLVFAVGFMALVERRRPRLIEVAGSLVCIAGLGAFWAIADPALGTDLPRDGAALVWGIVGIALVSITLSWALLARGEIKAMMLNITSGILFGYAAPMVKIVTGQLGRDPASIFTHWALYVLIVCAAAGFLLNLNAFQAGELAGPLAANTVVDPVIAIAIGATMLGETIRTGPAALAGETVGLVAMTVGVVLLARATTGSIDFRRQAPSPDPVIAKERPWTRTVSASESTSAAPESNPRRSTSTTAGSSPPE